MKSSKLLKALSIGAFACGLLASSGSANAAYPDRPIRLIVPFGAGSVTDQLARLVAEGLTTSLGQSVVVENKAGAGGNIGAAYVAESTADGYTLLLGSAGTNAINPSLYKNLKFDPMSDFAAVANVASVSNVLVVNPQVKARSVAELIGLAKKAPLNYASGGAGGSQHLSAELFKSFSKTDMTHIPYKGGSEPLPDLMSNRVQLMFCNLPVCLPHIRSGKLLALGVTSSKRSDLLPEVPTISEAGLPGYSVDGWFGLFAPVKTPAAITTRLHDAVEAILNAPATAQRIKQLGANANPETQQAFAAFVGEEHDKWKKVIDEAHIQVD